MSRIDSRWTEPDLQSVARRCELRSAQGIHCTVAFLGGCPQTKAEAFKILKEYLECVTVLGKQKLGASITVKPTSLGLLLDKTSCEDNILAVFNEATACGVGFEIATEGKDFVQFAIDAAINCAKEKPFVTISLQTYLDRTTEDLNTAIKNGIRPRLVKGAYAGDTTDHAEVQKRFIDLAEIVLSAGQPLLVGTHDPELIRWAIQRAGLNRQLVQFSFLKGLSEKTKVDLAKRGWSVLEYLPYGTNVEAYESRRWSFLRELEHLGRSPAP
jgi:proline dehydrogenase